LKEGLTSVEVNTDKGSMLWPELSGKGLGYRKPGSGVFGRATKNDAGES
jgi:hypothetical protein